MGCLTIMFGKKWQWMHLNSNRWGPHVIERELDKMETTSGTKWHRHGLYQTQTPCTSSGESDNMVNSIIDFLMLNVPYTLKINSTWSLYIILFIQILNLLSSIWYYFCCFAIFYFTDFCHYLSSPCLFKITLVALFSLLICILRSFVFNCSSFLI